MALSSPSALVIRLDAIGDALALVPLLAALRDAAIPTDLVLRGANARIFSSRAARATYVAPFALRSSTRENLRSIAEFGATLASNAYSHVLVATEDPGGYRLARATGAPERIGFSNGLGKPFKSLWVRSQVNHIVIRSAGLDNEAPHECEVLFKLGHSLLGTATPSRDPARLRPLVLENETSRGARTAFQITDKWERLGIAFDDVVQAMHNVRELGDIRAIAPERESAYARRIEAASGITVERFGELEPWKEAVAAAQLLVAPDSGALHVAGMVGTPTVAVFPPVRDFSLQTARWTPWAAPTRIVRAEGRWPDEVIVAVKALR